MHRLQLSRRRGFKLPPGAMSVARPNAWGNPFWPKARRTDPRTNEVVTVRSVEHAVELYEAWLRYSIEVAPDAMREAFDAIRGRDLACWCIPGEPCHADVLMKLLYPDCGNPTNCDGCPGCQGIK